MQDGVADRHKWSLEYEFAGSQNLACNVGTYLLKKSDKNRL
jgi:hypothetical protein